MKISIHPNIYKDPEYKINYTDMVKRIADNGFDAMDLGFFKLAKPQSILASDQWEQWAYQLRQAADDAGIVFGQAHAPMYSFITDDNKEFYYELTLRSIQACKILGIKWLVHHTNVCDDYPTNNSQKTINDNKKYFSKILEYSKKYGVGVCLENLFNANGRDGKIAYYNYGNTANELTELVDSFADKDMGICLDTGHANITCIDQADMIKTFGNRLKVVHFDDNDGFSDQHLLPYLGTIKWDPIMKALKEINYQGTLNFEIHAYIDNRPEHLKDLVLQDILATGKHLAGIFDNS